MRRSSLSANERIDLKKSTTKKLRAQGNLPATVYGKGTARSISVKNSDMTDILRVPGGRLSLIDLSIEGENPETVNVMIKDTQVNPLDQKIVHVDFHQVSLNEKVNASVPITFNGTAAGTAFGGILEQLVNNLEIKALPTNIPSHINLDVTHLNVGDKLYVSDIVIPSDIELVGPAADTIVISIHQPHVKEETVAEEDTATAVEPAE